MEADARGGQHRRLRLVVGGRIVPGEPREERPHLSLRLGRAAARGEASFKEQPAVATLLQPRLSGVVVGRGLDASEAQALDHRRGHPELRLQSGDDTREAGGRHADHLVGDAAQLQRLADNVRPAAKAPLPQAVAHHEHGVLSLADVLLRQEAASQHGPDPEQVEVVRAHRLAGGERGLASGRQDPAHERVRRHAREDVGSLDDREVVRVGAGEVRQLGARARVDLHQAAGIGHGGAAEQHGVHHAEQRRVEADAERQGEHRHRRESRPTDEQSNPVAKVVDELVHRLLQAPLPDLYAAAPEWFDRVAGAAPRGTRTTSPSPGSARSPASRAAGPPRA